jgi:hypothetical protein
MAQLLNLTDQKQNSPHNACVINTATPVMAPSSKWSAPQTPKNKNNHAGYKNMYGRQ